MVAVLRRYRGCVRRLEAVTVTTGVGAIAGALEALEAWAKMATMAMVIWCVLEVLLSLSLFLLQRWARKVELKVKVKSSQGERQLETGP